MRLVFPAISLLVALCTATGAQEPSAPDAEPQAEAPRAEEPEVEGDTPLIRLCRTACFAPEKAAELAPLITEELKNGADTQVENAEGCDAMFYLCGMPELLQQLRQQGLVPHRELSLRQPTGEAALQRYVHLRTAQADKAPNPGSLAYLRRRYLAPSFTRVRKLAEHYLAMDSPARVPEGGLRECLQFLHLAAPDKADAFVGSSHLWVHGEHFLEPLPSLFLSDLKALQWKVSPGKLRAALQSLATLLPTAQDDMIDCYAAAPMTTLLEMLVEQEGERALPDIQKYGKCHDPELQQSCLRMQLKLKGLTPPDEQEKVPPELLDLRAALLADTAMQHGEAPLPDADTLRRAAACLRAHDMPQRAELLEGLTDESGKVTVSEEGLPSLRSRYEDVKEPAPRPTLLHWLLEHPEQLNPVGQATDAPQEAAKP